ncbi:MAG: hypothetical protein H0W18_13110 [Acidobacteria bacterium]|nr:hypothetical protein [Acidobacteriota bacterium]
MICQTAKRTVLPVVLGVLLAFAPAAVEAQGPVGGSPVRKSSTAKRVTWTVIGAAAGFGLGAWFGLHKFDDAINSDRKVWTSALLGAAAGGVAGGLLSRNIGPKVTPNSQLPTPKGQFVPLQQIELGAESLNDRALLARIRAVNLLRTAGVP